jgi:predicted alpha/beta-hydrolase family hydrolase
LQARRRRKTEDRRQKTEDAQTPSSTLNAARSASAVYCTSGAHATTPAAVASLQGPCRMCLLCLRYPSLYVASTHVCIPSAYASLASTYPSAQTQRRKQRDTGQVHGADTFSNTMTYALVSVALCPAPYARWAWRMCMSYKVHCTCAGNRQRTSAHPGPHSPLATCSGHILDAFGIRSHTPPCALPPPLAAILVHHVHQPVLPLDTHH